MTVWRNVAIVAVIALAVLVVPGGGDAANLFAALLGLLFAGGIAFFVGRLYRENRVAIFGLGDRDRALFYGGLAVAAVAATATPRLWETGAGTAVWFVLVAGASWAVVVVVRNARRYS
ncbi:MAG: hypothetical protein QOI98_158 [Solirubrobacteraceae bacterium]|nr:hypothetical protein [Solirubrobacteraceae bacterium]